MFARDVGTQTVTGSAEATAGSPGERRRAPEMGRMEPVLTSCIVILRGWARPPVPGPMLSARGSGRRLLLSGHLPARLELQADPRLPLPVAPRGKPLISFVYSDEIWTGVEYQAAASMIYSGLVDEGLEVVKAVRDRHDGLRRNPWAEHESGVHYARAMSSWAVLLALSGAQYDGVEKSLGFTPRVHADEFFPSGPEAAAGAASR
jgi:hypothetical protein